MAREGLDSDSYVHQLGEEVGQRAVIVPSLESKVITAPEHMRLPFRALHFRTHNEVGEPSGMHLALLLMRHAQRATARTSSIPWYHAQKPVVADSSVVWWKTGKRK